MDKHFFLSRLTNILELMTCEQNQRKLFVARGHMYTITLLYFVGYHIKLFFMAIVSPLLYSYFFSEVASSNITWYISGTESNIFYIIYF